MTQEKTIWYQAMIIMLLVAGHVVSFIIWTGKLSVTPSDVKQEVQSAKAAIMARIGRIDEKVNIALAEQADISSRVRALEYVGYDRWKGSDMKRWVERAKANGIEVPPAFQEEAKQ